LPKGGWICFREGRMLVVRPGIKAIHEDREEYWIRMENFSM
jgi:hypothetical protein